ncbi:DUF3068 domain-containing protein [Actinomadura nitritigenes]|uniref:DUF3068 domain-containing protein n=1 Tax=Actinomadura nitritigenes TaxID=134602 RepID=A0ABS3R0K5_9ACTN|nr:DUF3068 domain-containing protein [Actinomadura nitritigenes]MBO2439769.1 DUF3068 domain-containing protein [Actinomadura nitritigenes]
MRRPVVGLILIGLGAFFLALAPLVRFYVADQVVQAPLNRYQVTRLESPNSTYFDQSDLKLKNGVTLRANNTIRGDVRANGGNNKIAVWDSTTDIYDQAKPDTPVQIQKFRIAFDRRTGVLVNCCGANVEGDSTVRMSGYGLLFPIGNVQKRDYPFFDMTTKQQAPMQYGGVERVHGLATYRFTQHIPLTKTASLDTKMPASMLGLPADKGNQKADRYTEAYNTMWVDPRTGIPVKQRENIRSWVQTPDGKGKMIVAQADLITLDKDQRGLVSMADKTALQIDLVRSYVPAGAVFVGLVLLLAGGLLGLMRDRTPPPIEAPRRPDGKFGDAGPPKPPGAPGAAAAPGGTAAAAPASAAAPPGSFAARAAAPDAPDASGAQGAAPAPSKGTGRPQARRAPSDGRQRRLPSRRR